MILTINKNLTEFKPETDTEKKQLDDLWKLVVDCAKFNKKLVPVGEYVPGKTETAKFVIEN